MSNDKAIDSTEFDSKLTTVADAIRTAGGTTEPMSFPSGMVSAISELKGGIDLTDEEILQSLIAANVLSAVTSGGEILTDENNNILMM